MTLSCQYVFTIPLVLAVKQLTKLFLCSTSQFGLAVQAISWRSLHVHIVDSLAEPLLQLANYPLNNSLYISSLQAQAKHEALTVAAALRHLVQMQTKYTACGRQGWWVRVARVAQLSPWGLTQLHREPKGSSETRGVSTSENHQI